MVGWELGPRRLHQNKYNFHFNSRIFQLYFCRRTKLWFLKVLLSLSFILMGSQYQRHPSCLIKVLVFIITAALCFTTASLYLVKLAMFTSVVDQKFNDQTFLSWSFSVLSKLKEIEMETFRFRFIFWLIFWHVLNFRHCVTSEHLCTIHSNVFFGILWFYSNRDLSEPCKTSTICILFFAYKFLHGPSAELISEKKQAFYVRLLATHITSSWKEVIGINRQTHACFPIFYGPLDILLNSYLWKSRFYMSNCWQHLHNRWVVKKSSD